MPEPEESPTAKARSKATVRQGKPAQERRGGMRALGASLPGATRRAFGRRGLAEAGLIAQWPEVVGGELAALCVPRRISFARRDRREDGVLTLRVASGHALAIQHLEPLILARISSHMGYLAVTRLRLEQGPLPAPRPKAKPRPAPPPEDLATLESRLEGLEDPALASAFRRLGRALLERDSGTESAENT